MRYATFNCTEQKVCPRTFEGGYGNDHVVRREHKSFFNQSYIFRFFISRYLVSLCRSNDPGQTEAPQIFVHLGIEPARIMAYINEMYDTCERFAALKK